MCALHIFEFCLILFFWQITKRTTEDADGGFPEKDKVFCSSLLFDVFPVNHSLVNSLRLPRLPLFLSSYCLSVIDEEFEAASSESLRREQTISHLLLSELLSDVVREVK